MGLVLPSDHDSAEIWDVILDTAFGLIDSHDHTTGKGVKIAAAALNINADVSWSSGGTSHAITDLTAIDFVTVAPSSVTSLAGALFISNVDSNLYYRTTAGSNVQVTIGAALNVAGFAGGIGGDYSTAGALELFDDATDSYWFQQQIGAAVRQYARMRCADVDLYEFKANPTAGVPTNRVRLASPAALAASYAFTLPAALPAAIGLLASDSAGNLTVPTSPALSANANFVLSGTGVYKQGIKTVSRMLTNGMANVQSGSLTPTAGGGAGATFGASAQAVFPLPELPQHCRIVNVRVYYASATDRTNMTSAVIFQTSSADPAGTAYATTGFSLTNSGTAIQNANGVNLTPSGSRTYHIQFTAAPAVNPIVISMAVDYDVP
jgi:hypothetical protein